MSAPLRPRQARVTLQSPTRVADEIGGAAIAWSDKGEVWATIHATSATQLDLFDTRPAIAGFRLTINRREDVRAGWRVLWAGRDLRITGVSDGGAPRIVLICEEEKL